MARLTWLLLSALTIGLVRADEPLLDCGPARYYASQV